MNTAVTPNLTLPAAIPADWDWPEFWDYVHAWMKQQGYAHSTARLYRQVLRNFARFAGCPPAEVTRPLMDHYLRCAFGTRSISAHWNAVSLSTLRVVFDQLFGLDLLSNRRGPRRPRALPHTLNQDEARSLFGAAETVTDRLMVGLFYGCGLTVSELRHLRWRDVDIEETTVRAAGTRQLRARLLPLPESLLSLAQAAGAGRPPEAPVFPGRRPGRALTPRRIEQCIRALAERAKLGTRVTPQILRHSFAVQCLENGENIRALQEALGHHSIHTTLRYARCLLPPDAHSPLDDLFPRIPTATPGAGVAAREAPAAPAGDQEGLTRALIRRLKMQFPSRRRPRGRWGPWRRTSPVTPHPP